MSLAVKVEDLSKRYRLGVINRDMLYKDLQSRWAKLRGKPDPNAPITHIHQNRIEKGDEFWALRNINLEVREGEVLGIIGKNGAGKSTLLKILSHITAPTEGKIKIRGRIASLLEVGTGFHPELTGRENVFLNGAILGMSRSEVRSKFDEIVQFSEIEEFIDTPVKRYSSGMYVRLAFAVAAHLDPEILIVDEVLAVGDAEFQKKCIGKMQTVSNQGKTVLFVSHNLNAVAKLCTTACVLDQGQITTYASVKDATHAYVGESTSGIGQLDANKIAEVCKKLHPYFTLTGFSLRTEKGSVLTSDVEALDNTKLKIVVDGVWGRCDENFNLGFGMENEKADRLICSFFKDNPEKDWPECRQNKKVRLEAELDTSWLVESTYTVRLIAGLHRIRMLVSDQENATLTFAVRGVRSSSPIHTVNNRGVLLSPEIAWRSI